MPSTRYHTNALPVAARSHYCHEVNRDYLFHSGSNSVNTVQPGYVNSFWGVLSKMFDFVQVAANRNQMSISRVIVQPAIRRAMEPTSGLLVIVRESASVVGFQNSERTNWAFQCAGNEWTNFEQLYWSDAWALSSCRSARLYTSSCVRITRRLFDDNYI